MPKDFPCKFRGRAAAICAAFGVVSLMALSSGVLVASAASTGKPVNTLRPKLAGAAARGSQITLTPGTFSNETSQKDTLYQCTSATGNIPTCTATANTGDTYTLGTSDPLGDYLRLDETATNAQGTATVWSDRIGPITAASTDSSAAVPSTLDVPSSENPAGGWTLEYGDAFGSPDLYEGGTDNTWYPGGNGSCTSGYPYGDPSTMIAYGECAETSVESDGLNISCSYGHPSGSPTDNPAGAAYDYSCGGAYASWSSIPSSSYHTFSWLDPYNSGHTIAIQWEWKLPPDYQFDPAIWGTGTYTGADADTGDEIDLNESFGWGGSASPAATNWSSSAYTQPTIVGGSPYTYLTYGFDPSAAMHTYTVVLNGSTNTYQSYIDGSQISSGAFASGGPEYQSLLWNMDMRGGSSACTSGACADPVPGFTSGSHALVVRYVGYYEDTAHAGQGVELAGCAGGYPCASPTKVGTPPLIAPGSTKASAAADTAMYAKVNALGRDEARMRTTVAKRAAARARSQRLSLSALIIAPAKAKK